MPTLATAALLVLGATVDTPLALEVGTQQVLSFRGLTRVAVGDPAVLEVKVVDGRQLLLTGTKPGRTSVTVWRSSGALERFPVWVMTDALDDVVKPDAVLPRATPANAPAVRLFAGAQRLVPAPGVSKVVVSDGSVCEAAALGDDLVLVVGASPGRATLQVWREGGGRTTLEVAVSELRLRDVIPAPEARSPERSSP